MGPDEVKVDGLLAQARSEAMPAVMAMLASQESVAEKRCMPWILPWISLCLIVMSYVMVCMELHPLIATPCDEGSMLMTSSLELYRWTPPVTEFLAKRPPIAHSPDQGHTGDIRQREVTQETQSAWSEPYVPHSISVVSTPWWTWTPIGRSPLGGVWLPSIRRWDQWLRLAIRHGAHALGTARSGPAMFDLFHPRLVMPQRSAFASGAWVLPCSLGLICLV